MNATDKEKLDMQARAQQMKINTRLTALQSVHTLMGHSNYHGEVDAISLIAMASEIEGYILGQIEQETKDVLEQLNKPKPTIVPAKEIPNGLRPDAWQAGVRR